MAAKPRAASRSRGLPSSTGDVPSAVQAAIATSEEAKAKGVRSERIGMRVSIPELHDEGEQPEQPRTDAQHQRYTRDEIRKNHQNDANQHLRQTALLLA